MTDKSSIGQPRLARALPFVLPFAIATLMLGSPGCGGSSSDSSPGGSTLVASPTPTLSPSPTAGDPTAAQASVETGKAQLNNLLQSPGNPTLAQLQAIQTTFASAHAADGSNSQAAFGFAASSIAATTQSALIALGAASRAAGSTGTSDTLKPLSDTILAVNPWSGQALSTRSLKNTLSRATTAPIAMTQVRIGHRSVDINALRTSLIALRQALDGAIPAAKQAAGDPNFAFTMYDFNHNGGTLTADQGDAQTFLSGLYATRAVISAALAYNVDYGSFDFNQKLRDKFGANLQTGFVIKPDDYLPAAPFATLNTDGQAYMKSVISDLQAAANTAQTATATLRARASGAGHLVPTTGVDFSAVSGDIAQVQSALTGNYTFASSQPVTVNIPGWFNSPPPSLRALEPTYTITSVDTNNTQNFTMSASAPDRTLGGLVVNPPSSGALTATYYGTDSLANLASASYLTLR